MFCSISSYDTCLNDVFPHLHRPHSFCHSFIALPMIRRSKSAQKSAVQVRQVATVVIETHSGFKANVKTFYRSQWIMK